MNAPAKPLPPDFRLTRGAHEPPNGGFEACLLEAVSYVAGEPWTDHPACVSPVLAAFGRSWNDTLDDDDRQMLVPLIPRLIGTASTDEVEDRRSWMATDWLVREFTPAWLRLAGLTDHAHTLESLVALTDTASARSAKPSIAAAGDAAWDAAGAAAGTAAWDAAWAAAGAAAWDAARDAARDAAGAAAGDAAGAAAGDAAGDAAGAAAGDAAWDAAGDAARAALQPTVKALQVSAIALIERMIEVKP